MVATVSTRGVLKASQNRVRTSVALQGNAMWENVIGVVNEQAGSNAGVEALIRAPSHGGGRKAAQERRAAAQSAVLATGGFDTAITNYQSLLSLAKSQGAVGGGTDRGACRICGHVGHLTKQCRNAVAAADGAGPSGAEAAAATLALEDDAGAISELDDLSDLDSGSDSDRERRRSRKRKHKHHKKSHKKSKKHKKKKSRRSSSSSDSD